MHEYFDPFKYVDGMHSCELKASLECNKLYTRINLSRAYKEKRACNLQCILCMRRIIDESAGFNQQSTRE